MKKLMKYASILSALVVVVSNASSMCFFANEEPKMPKGLIK